MKPRSGAFSFLGSGVGSGGGVGIGAAGGAFGCLRPDCPCAEIAQAATISKQHSRNRDLDGFEFITLGERPRIVSPFRRMERANLLNSRQ